MNELIKRGFSAYKIVLRNKLATSIMMLIGGVGMLIGGITGNGNDTKTMPSLIALAGGVFTCWAFYRIGYVRATYEKSKGTEREKGIRGIVLICLEALLYLVVLLFGLFLLLNESFTDKILNVMTGVFTILNGIFGTIFLIKNRESYQTFMWRLRLGLTILEYALGIFFIFASDDIAMPWYITMGVITIIAGIIEVFSALTKEQLEQTMKDGKEIIKTLKDEKKNENQKAIEE